MKRNSKNSSRSILVAWSCLFFGSIAFLGASHPAIAQAVPQAQAIPSVVDVGDVQAGVTSYTQAITLTNTGSTDCTVAVVYPSGLRYAALGCGDAGDFHVTDTLHPGEACINELTVAEGVLIPPGSRGPGSATVFYEINGGELEVPVTVLWNVVPRYLDADTSVQDLGLQQIGTVGPPSVRTVANNTSAALDIGVQVLVGTAPDCSGHFASELCRMEIDQQLASFIVGSDGCHPIPPSATCDITIRFNPRAVYAMTGAIRLSAPDNRAVRELQWQITGTGIPAQTNAMTVLAIEYFNTASSHYFITAAPLEISALDGGLFAGWQRSGRSFWVLPPDYSGPEPSTPVCRYYGRPEAGLDSHFYSASPTECGEVATRFSDAWQLESEDVFRVGLPDASSGACATGMPVYRLYDNRSDADHRYTIDAQVRANMIAAGWVSEGYGADGVAMCAP